MAESQPEISENRQWAKQVLKEYREYQNPQVTPDIDIVWAISGRGVYTQETTPHLSNPEFARSDLARNDDRENTDFAAQLVRQITAARLNKNASDVTLEDIERNGPILVYNGSNLQNQKLKDAVDSGAFPLPKEKVKILKLSETDDPREANTHTQFERFPQELLENLITRSRKIALVSARWHFPRLSRTINAPAVSKKQPLWEKVNIAYFVSDRNKENLPPDAASVTKRAIDIRKAVVGEGRRIAKYSQEGTTNPKPRIS